MVAPARRGDESSQMCLHGLLCDLVMRYLSQTEQALARKEIPGLVNSVAANALHISLTLLPAFTQPDAHLFSQALCMKLLLIQ